MTRQRHPALAGTLNDVPVNHAALNDGAPNPSAHPGGGRRRRTIRRPIHTTIVILVALILLIASGAQAKQVSFDYGDTVRTFRVCAMGILGPPPPPAANVFVNLANSPWLPQGWVLSDPIGSAAGAPYAVALTGLADVKQLSDYDLILIPDLPDLTALGRPDIEDALKQICDSGAVLWLDFSAQTPPPAPAIADFAIIGGPGGGEPLDPLPSTLLQRPYALSPAELLAVGRGSPPPRRVDITNARTILRPVIGTLPPPPNSWNRPGVAAGEYGSGGLIVSATDVVALDTSPALGDQAALRKFVCNVLEWSQRWDQDRATPRHHASVNLTVKAPLQPRWQFPDPLRPMVGQPNGVSIGPMLAQPVIADGVAYVVDSVPLGNTSWIRALDIHPSRDLDGDGLADDGVADYSLGAPYDILWEHPLVDDGGGNIGTPLFAAPCVATRQATPGGAPQRVVLVTTLNNGLAHLVMYDAVTGAPLVYRNDSMGGVQYPNNPTTEWVSSPVVYDGYVYVLTQEVRNGVHYTRVYAVDLDTLGTAGGAVWAYPVPALEPDPDLVPPVIDPAAIPVRPGPTPSVSASAFASLQPPGAAGPAPRLLDAVVRFGTDISFTSDTTPGNGVCSAPLDGGSEFAIVPTPTPAAGIGPNNGYYTAYLTGDPTATPTTALQDDDTTVVPPASYVAGVGYAAFDEDWVRAYLADEANLPVEQPSPDPIGWQEGRPVRLTYATPGTESVFLRGPVLWKRRLSTIVEPRVASHVVDGDTVFAATRPLGGPTVLRALNALDGSEVFSFARALLGGPTATIGAPACDADTLYFAHSTPANTGLTALKTEATSTIVLGCGPPPAPANAQVIPGSVMVEVQFVAGGPRILVDPINYRVNYKTRELFIRPHATDPATGQPLPLAGFPIWVAYTHDNGDPSNPGGWVTIADELHFVPDPRRYAVEPGTIKLRYPLAINAAGNPLALPEVYLAGYGQAAAAQIAPPPVSLDGRVNLSGLTTGPGSVPAAGHWVEVHYVGYSEYDLPPGMAPTPVIVGTPAATPPGALTLLPPELHYVPPVLPDSIAAAAASGDTVHFGTNVNPTPGLESYTLASVRWQGRGSTTRTTLSRPSLPHISYAAAGLAPPVVEASPAVSGVCRDPIDVPAAPGADPYNVQAYLLTQRSLPVIPPLAAASGPIIVRPRDDGIVVAGSYSRAAPTPGFIAGLAPTRTLITEGSRMVEVLGDEVERVITGTASFLPAEPEQPAFATAVRSARALRPFAQPAKVRVLDPDRNIRVYDPALVSADPNWPDDMRVGTRICATHYLVVDTANDRVVEIDQSGNVVWPLERGVNPINGAPVWYEKDLGLRSPSDAYRWVALDPQDLDGNGSTADIVYHTTVADTGNARIVDFQTIVHPDVWYPPAATPETCEQIHISGLDVKSPSYLLVDLNPLDGDNTPTKLARVAYTHAYPLFDPANGAPVGYLAAAANLNRFVVIDTSDPNVTPIPFPPAGSVPMGGTMPWDWIAWLYDRNLDGVADDPLLFGTIKDAQLFPEPSGLIVTPTGTWPTNGRGPWPTATDYQPGPGRDLWLTVTCGRYLNPPPGGNFAARMGATALAPGSVEGQSIVEFNVDFPTGGGFGFPTGAADEPSWFFTDVDYHYANPYAGPTVRPYTTLTDETGATAPKPWMPSSARRLWDGRHLIVNAAPQRSAITPANFLAVADPNSPLGQDTSLSEIIQIESDYGSPMLHRFGVSDLIPNFMLPPWPEGLNQPTCAVRY